jgi:hypothetical protein
MNERDIRTTAYTILFCTVLSTLINVFSFFALMVIAAQ